MKSKKNLKIFFFNCFCPRYTFGHQKMPVRSFFYTMLNAPYLYLLEIKPIKEIYLIFLDEEYFPEPNSFRPERFLKENADNLVEFTWRPFGSGQRVCIGQRFAMTEMKIFLAKFVSKFKINEVPETKFVPACGSIFLNLYETLIVELVERQSQ